MKIIYGDLKVQSKGDGGTGLGYGDEFEIGEGDDGGR